MANSRILFNVGLGRSGTHALADWSSAQFTNGLEIIDGPVDKHKKLDRRRKIQNMSHAMKHSDGAFVFYNGIPPKEANRYIKDCCKKTRALDHKSLLLIRDPFNVLASFMKVYYDELEKTGRKTSKQVFGRLSRLVDLYKKCAREYLGVTSFLSNKILVNYNTWVNNAEYREKLSSLIDGDNFSDETMDYVSHVKEKGHIKGSSFDRMKYDGNARNMKVHERYLYATTNKAARQKMKKLWRQNHIDDEMIDISLSIFGDYELYSNKDRLMMFLSEGK